MSKRVNSGEKSSILESPVVRLPGVGGERESQLARLGIHTVEDLLLHKPRRYEDRRKFCRIADLKLNEPAVCFGSIVALGEKRYRKGTRSIFEIIVEDGTGRLHCRWWNSPYMVKVFQQGDPVLVFGKPRHLKPRTMDHPETEIVEDAGEASIDVNRIVPVYPLTEGLTQRWLRHLIHETVGQHADAMIEPHPEIPLSNWPSRSEAIRLLHCPEELPDAEKARQRLALDEFIELQSRLQKRRRALLQNAEGYPCAGDNRLIKPLLANLGFELTPAQIRVLQEIRTDLGGGVPMRRLLQGDVGSGKTVVAACATLMTIESGYNAALMAPTEILAEQHFQTFHRWFSPLSVPVQLHTGTFKTTESTERNRLVIGTHALIESRFEIDRLGLTIIDEQHKFGVGQREKFLKKGRYPHLLVMTATPIPRTLALTVYGDLDLSVIDELPRGRGRVKTFVRASERLPKVWEFLRQKIRESRQSYVVYPRVEETSDDDVRAVLKDVAAFRKLFPECRVEVVHGRMSSDERERIMADFRARRIHILLATTVIEVGVDVPNATIMVVQNAERFGLSQLHQLRGRIGRGAHESYCILISDHSSEESRRRLEAMAHTGDGFEIAELDLQFRGAGDLAGQQQSGMPKFKFGDLTADKQLIEEAKRRVVEWMGRILTLPP